MPNSRTFEIKPIADLLEHHVRGVSVDPFARNAGVATFTNDLNPATKAGCHMQADEFCRRLHRQGIIADTVLFDPPYSPRQITECYRSIGLAVTSADTQNARLYRTVRDELDQLLRPGGTAISFGWNTVGFGRERGYELVEVVMICHGGAHNDTLVTVERKNE